MTQPTASKHWSQLVGKMKPSATWSQSFISDDIPGRIRREWGNVGTWMSYWHSSSLSWTHSSERHWLEDQMSVLFQWLRDSSITSTVVFVVSSWHIEARVTKRHCVASQTLYRGVLDQLQLGSIVHLAVNEVVPALLCTAVGCGCWQVFENLVDIQKELSLSVQELMKLQKIYKEEEHITHDARNKAADADDKSVLLTYCYLLLL